MSSSNWVGDNRDLSPDRNSRYRLDNVGLQLGLGFPLELIGVSLVENMARTPSERWLGQLDRTTKGYKNQDSQNGEIQQTVDGIPIRKVYVTNIHIEVQRPEMYDIFARYGTIMNVFLGISKNDNLKQFAFITFSDPKDAARVLQRRKFQDIRGRAIFATAADSWHQPKEGPDGQIIWKVDRRAVVKLEEENEDDYQSLGAVGGQIRTIVEVNEEGINVLNDDCLLHIFSFLTLKEVAGVERVCKRWQALSFRTWRCLHELSFYTPPFNKLKSNTPILEQCLRRCGESLTSLDLTVPSHSFNQSTLAVVAKYCNNLEELRLASIFLGNRSLAHLGRCCPKLKQLFLNGCLKFNDKDLLSLLPKCHDLNNFDLSNTNGVTGKCLVNIEGPITSLSLSSCPTLESSYVIAGLQKMSKTLKSLSLSACGSMRSSDVVKIVSAVPNLTSLNLSRCFPQFDPRSLCPVGQLTKLTSLNLHLNSAVNDNVLAAIVDGCENLTSVNLSGSGGVCVGLLSERGLSMLARLRKLTDLDISYLECTTSLALKNIAARSSRLKRFVCRGCPDLTDDGSIQVVTMCNELELFDLSGCNKISEGTISAARTSVKMRTNNVPLLLIMGGTNAEEEQVSGQDLAVPSLSINYSDLCEEHLRPDFIDDMFFPPTDSEDDDDEDIEHLCERIGCDCDCDLDFDFYDPTVIPCDDDTRKFGGFDDSISDDDDDIQVCIDEDDFDYYDGLIQQGLKLRILKESEKYE